MDFFAPLESNNVGQIQDLVFMICLYSKGIENRIMIVQNL